MQKILVTGFGPFGGEPVNPALEAVKVLNGRTIAGAQVVTGELPVVGHECIEKLIGLIKEIDPVLVVAVGQAGGRVDITPERVAINVDDFRIKDNAGRQPVDEPIAAGGPAAYWSTLPVKAIVSHLRSGGIPASVSNSAGTYVCNNLFYGLMHHLASEGNRRRGGFIHIPYLPEQAARNPGQPSLALATVARGLELAIEAAMENASDIKQSDGKTH
ncbi:MAG TPA: pyroglutamyl-peptidase I [Selenomonadales bacterium]|nr:pyroglutamyl-peptidase I [Selenomonadales bacterium]